MIMLHPWPRFAREPTKSLSHGEATIFAVSASALKIGSCLSKVIVNGLLTLAAMECGEGMEYQACGSVCMPTCKDPEGQECGDTDVCEEGCFCKEGTVFDGVGSCYSSTKCGCKVPEQGNVYINVRWCFARHFL